MKEIESRQDISHLVDTFYSKIRANELLGPIFNGRIPEDQWPIHLSKLTDFWETNLFGIPKFKGSPTAKHISVDQSLNYGIETAHFDEWLGLWFETVDELFAGDLADKAKQTAHRMATGQYLVIWGNRPENQDSMS